MTRLVGFVTVAAALLLAPAASTGQELRHIVGALHAHSAYSDGWPGTRPADFYASAARFGLGFMGGSDHSDNLGLPVVLSEACIGGGRGGSGEVLAAQCLLADQVNPADSLRKWEATAEQAAAATAQHPGFAGLRGFEWSSNRFNHLNVYFSRNYTSAYSDGGQADMGTFWQWFTRAPSLGGGADGLGTFNHPGAKDLEPLAGRDWEDFRHVAAADERMVGIEVFNDRSEDGSAGGPYPEGSYARALDRGWHVGAIGAEDLGHRKPPLDDWGGPGWAKTVVLAPEATPAAIRAALLDRSFYAIGPGEGALRLGLTVDGERMGSRLARRTGAKLSIAATTSDPAITLELLTTGGKIVASGKGRLRVQRRASARERWLFVRAWRGEQIVGYSSPVWIEAADGRRPGAWRAGDLHVHSCYSHDAYCPETDPVEDADTIYSSFGTIAERFAEAAVKGLDYLLVSDHNDVRAQSDPDFGSQGVLGLRGYESSLAGGHAQLMGTNRIHDRGDGSARATNELAADVRRGGGLFQINHATYRLKVPFTGCAQAAGESPPLHWRYGFEVAPDSLELWNATTLLAPAELYYECLLQSGFRIGITGGSDSHGGNQLNIGNPTTWVFSRARSEASILQAVRAGRTTLSRFTPSQGGGRLLLEADGDRDGSFEAAIGDTVAPGSPMRVRLEGATTGGLLRVRANGATLFDERRLEPGAPVLFTAPADEGWVRATLRLRDGLGSADPGCAPSGQSIAVCTDDLAIVGMTSPLYLQTRKRGERPAPPGPPRGEDTVLGSTTIPPARPDADPDEEAPLPGGEQSAGSSELPTVPRQRVGLAKRLRLAIHRRPDDRLLLSWTPADSAVDLQLRRPGARRWQTLLQTSQRTSLAYRARPGSGALRFRLRRHDPAARPGAWVRRASRPARQTR